MKMNGLNMKFAKNFVVCLFSVLVFIVDVQEVNAKDCSRLRGGYDIDQYFEQVEKDIKGHILYRARENLEDECVKDNIKARELLSIVNFKDGIANLKKFNRELEKKSLKKADPHVTAVLKKSFDRFYEAEKGGAKEASAYLLQIARVLHQRYLGDDEYIAMKFDLAAYFLEQVAAREAPEYKDKARKEVADFYFEYSRYESFKDLLVKAVEDEAVIEEVIRRLKKSDEYGHEDATVNLKYLYFSQETSISNNYDLLKISGEEYRKEVNSFNDFILRYYRSLGAGLNELESGSGNYIEAKLVAGRFRVDIENYDFDSAIFKLDEILSNGGVSEDIIKSVTGLRTAAEKEKSYFLQDKMYLKGLW